MKQAFSDRVFQKPISLLAEQCAELVLFLDFHRRMPLNSVHCPNILTHFRPNYKRQFSPKGQQMQVSTTEH
jgi:hypothetical protein